MMSVQPPEMQQKCNCIMCYAEESGIWIFLGLGEYLHLVSRVRAIKERRRAEELPGVIAAAIC